MLGVKQIIIIMPRQNLGLHSNVVVTDGEK